jgi:membrane protease YdiL (CAAX protease family)
MAAAEPSIPQLDQVEAASPPVVAARPWGFWATLGFTVLILFAWVVSQIVAALVYLFATPSGRAAFNQLMRGSGAKTSLGEDGTLLALGGVFAGLLLPPVCVLCAWLKRRISVQDYLGLRNAPLGVWLGWLGICLVFCAASDTLTWLVGRPIVPEFMDKTYRSVAFVPLLWLAVVVGAPFSEEFLFRGFALTGFRYSWLRSAGAIVLTSLGWTALHTQYDFVDLANLFLFGLVLGYARIRTASLWIPIGMHALNNLWATVEVAIKVHYWP